MSFCLHLGNVLYLVAYSVRDMLWLRVLTVVATVSLIAYYAAHSLYEPIAWGVLFMAVNCVQIVLLVLERRPVFLGEEELQLYRTLFRGLQPREFTRLLSVAEWRKARHGEELLAQNKPVPALLLISSGRGTVEIDGRAVAEVCAGQFVGEMGFLTEQDASARVVASATTDYLAWPVAKLRALLAASPSLHVKVQGILGADLVGKLRQEAMSAAHPSRMFDTLRGAGVE